MDKPKPSDLLEQVAGVKQWPKKPAGELLLGDIIVEKDRKKTFFYRVTAITVAACSPHKTHITVDGHTNWCYDMGQEVMHR